MLRNGHTEMRYFPGLARDGFFSARRPRPMPEPTALLQDDDVSACLGRFPGMARKVSRSRADQPQSNTALIVFLVFSILINLTVGVFLYLSIDKVDQATKAANDAKAAQATAEKQRQAMETFLVLLRTVIGDTTIE